MSKVGEKASEAKVDSEEMRRGEGEKKGSEVRFESFELNDGEALRILNERGRSKGA